MKIVAQRSSHSSVTANDRLVSQIDRGMVLLVCLEKGDTLDTIDKAVYKTGNLRIFTDPVSGKMARSIQDIRGEFLAISQFTLSWDGSGGHRPGFDRSMGPDEAKNMFSIFCEKLSAFAPVHQGGFGADMQVHIQNDGPVTFMLSF